MQYTGYTFRTNALSEGLTHETVYDLLSAQLGEIGFDSFEIVDDTLRAYVPTCDEQPELIACAIGELPFEDIQISYQSEVLPDVNWNEEWEKHYFQPIILGDGACMIRAPFHSPAPNIPTEIIINPKMAFGTGNHDTTSLVIRYLLNTDLKGKRVLDMGCGTGILGILALKQGAESLTAIDIDEWAYQNVLENARLNGVEIKDAVCGDASHLDGRGPYDLVVANITRNILYEDLPRYVAVMMEDAHIVLSGFYEEDLPMLIERGEELGLSYISQAASNRWALLEMKRN